MSSPKDIRTRTNTIAAGSVWEIPQVGNYIAVLSDTGAFQLQIDDGAPFDFQAGLKIRMDREESFRIVRILNPGAGAVTVELVIGSGDFEDARLTLIGDVDLSEPSTCEGINDTSIPAASVGTVRLAEAARRALRVTNLSPTVTLRFGENPDAQRGVPVGPGETMEFPGTGLIEVYNPGGAAVWVARLVILD